METQHILTLVAAIITIVIAWSGFLVAVIKFLLDRSLALQDEKINGLTIEVKRQNEEQSKFLSQLPVLYVRKDDCRTSQESWIREAAALEHKMNAQFDRIIDKFEELRKELYARNA